MKKLLSIALLTMSFAQPVLCMENNNNNNESKKIVLSPEEQKSLNNKLNVMVSLDRENEVKKLLDLGADVNYRDDHNKETFLHSAVKNNNIEIAKLLINNGADVNAKDVIAYNTPLHYSCINGNAELAELLVNANADITAKQGDFLFTPLQYACLYGHIKIAQLLIKKDIDSIYTSSNAPSGKTVLNLALLNKHYNLALTLFKSLIKPTAIDWNQKKVVFIGNLKENPKDCSFATLPLEMIHNIFSFCSDKKENIARIKKLIDLSNITPDSQDTLGYIVKPQSWADEKTAEQTYDKLIALIKEMDEQDKQTKEEKKD